MWRRWAPTVAVLLLLPAFIAAGCWQLDRADQKRRLQDEYDTRTRGPVLAIDAALRVAEDLRYHRVQARGVYEPERQVLLENRVHRGRPGYHVITPLRIDGGETRVLVNRGWVAIGEGRDRLPSVDAPAGLQQVSGVATVPAEKYFTLREPDPL
ncbi:MAG: SURF1 family protein, partial [Pseudomonadota bacterium]